MKTDVQNHAALSKSQRRLSYDRETDKKERKRWLFAALKPKQATLASRCGRPHRNAAGCADDRVCAAESQVGRTLRCNERAISLFITTFFPQFPFARPAKEADVVLFCEISNNYNIFVVIIAFFARFYNVEAATPPKMSQSSRKRCRFLIFAAKVQRLTLNEEKAASCRSSGRPRLRLPDAAAIRCCGYPTSNRGESCRMTSNHV